MNDLSGKVAVVTGASKGIGAALARALAKAGAAVTVNYAGDEAGAQQTVDAVINAGGRAVAVQGDVAKSADVARIFDVAARTFGQVDIVVNNAGVFSFAPIEAATEDEYRREFDVNVLGPILTTQQALNYFPSSGGSIINLSSVITASPQANAAIYASSKSALDALTSVLAQELGPRHIRVNSVAPGVTDSEGFRAAGLGESDFVTVMVPKTPLGRIGMPADIAPLVVFLASDDAAWITGERITASGGLRL